VRPARLVAATAISLCACGSATAASGAAGAGGVKGTITVFAATSLTAAFEAEAAAFQRIHPAAKVTFNFGGSSELATQLNQGAPADVFASADQPNLQKVGVAGNLAGRAQTFAGNKLEIAVAPGDPKGIHGLADLARGGLIVVLCAPAVPCGHYADQALDRAGVHVTPESQEQNVAGVLSKVESGDADAGIVYTTDVEEAGGRVGGVQIPAEQNVVAGYPIALVKGGANAAGGRAFIEFVLSADGQAILARYGFSKP
jgi:molybdate transport system substrate-binding protein